MAKEHGILMRDWCVRAILDGRKTQTRRKKTTRDRWSKAKPDDTLWVRETHEFRDGECVYRATRDPLAHPVPLWTPSLLMPRKACRITLKITGIRTERVGDISEADAKAEGVTPRTGESYRDAFFREFAGINGDVDLLEEVYVLTFRRLT